MSNIDDDCKLLKTYIDNTLNKDQSLLKHLMNRL